MVKVAIFDFDGTLANTLPDLKITINLTRERYDLPPVTEEDVLRHVNNHIPRYIELMLPELGDPEKWKEAEQTYYAIYDHNYLNETVPYEGIPEILAKLKADGIKLAVMSNKNHEHVSRMVEALFPGVFDSVWGTIPEVPAKPNPARAYLIAEELGAEMSEIAFIGDSDVDMITAVNAKTVPVGVSWGYRPAECLKDNGAVYTPVDAMDLYHTIKSI